MEITRPIVTAGFIKATRALGLTIPSSTLAQAAKVIE